MSFNSTIIAIERVHHILIRTLLQSDIYNHVNGNEKRTGWMSLSSSKLSTVMKYILSFFAY